MNKLAQRLNEEYLNPHIEPEIRREPERQQVHTLVRQELADQPFEIVHIEDVADFSSPPSTPRTVPVLTNHRW